MYRQTEIVSENKMASGSEGDLVINVGPQHPATHGVLHLVITLNGETIRKVEPHLGYIHRSIEKMCESLTYRQFIYVTSRMDYLSAHINNHACALCVEKGMQIEIPPRATSSKVSKRMKLSKRFSFIATHPNSTIPITTATINPVFVPHNSSAAIKTKSGIKPGSSFLSNCVLVMFSEM